MGPEVVGQDVVGQDVTGAISLRERRGAGGQWGRTSWGRRLVGQDVVGQNFVRQDVAGAKSLGQVVMGQKVLGQDVGHHFPQLALIDPNWPKIKIIINERKQKGRPCNFR